jgi:PhoH-like ATPase
MSNRKILVVDTSVLLYDMTAIHSFPGNDVVIPLTVLDEIDRFKDKPGLIGESARYVNRFLDDLRKLGRLDHEVKFDNHDQTIRVEIDSYADKKMHPGLERGSGDNRIVTAALCLKQKYPERVIKVVTKDINLRVKCDALGITAEDYYKDHIQTPETQYTGQTEVILPGQLIDKFFNDKGLDVEGIQELQNLSPNQFIVASDGSSKSFLGIYRQQLKRVSPLHLVISESAVEPKNKEQKFALNMLNDPDIPLVSLTGIAGSGKTFLSLISAIESVSNGTYKRLVITRSIQPVGRDLGYLPGDMDDKMHPWLAPILDNFKHGFGDLSYFDIMREKGSIDIAPLAYIRGRTFNNSFVIVDEAQNASIHELKTIITRVGKDSKIVLLGDTEQIDTPYIDSRSNGLSIVVEKFKKESIGGHIMLKKGQRSNLATIASKIL